MAAETFLDRLDRVPLNRFHWKLLIVSGVGWMFNALDVILISFVLAPIQSEFGLDVTRTSLVAGAGFVGMFLGAAVSGWLADRYGRRTLFQWTLVVFSVGSLFSAAAPSFELLLAARLVTGLGLGGELPVVSTLLAEFAPRATRGRLIVLLESFWAYGTILAGVVALVVLPGYGWRAVFLIGALPALYVAYLRRALPESPRYLAGHDRIPEADAAVRRVEREGGGALITVAKPVPPERRTSGGPRMAGINGVGVLFEPRYVRRTLMLWILWFGTTLSYYGLFSLIRNSEFFFISAVAQVPGYFSAAWLVERVGRRPTLVAYLAGSAISAALFGNGGAGTDAVLYATLLSFFSLGAAGVGYAISTELYPTPVRATGAGTASAVGRIGGLLGLFFLPTFAAAYGGPAIFGLFLVLLLLTAAAVALLSEETRTRTRTRSLETLSPAA